MHIRYETFSPIASMPQDEQEAVEVVQGEWRHSLETLITERAGNCLLLGVDNDEGSGILLGHFLGVADEHDPDLDNQAFLEALDAVSVLGPLEQTSIWLGGAALFAWGDRTEQQVLADRAYAVEKVNGLFAARANIIEDWTADPYTQVHACLDATAGLLTVNRQIAYPTQP